MFSLDFPIIVYCLAGGAALCALGFALLIFGKLKRVMRRSITDARLSMPADEKFPPVSIIVHDDARARNLVELLPRLLEQDYPAEVEVIVVNDGRKADTEEVIARLEPRYPNLYMTFLPERSRNLSRRKLAVTLGIKAARYDVVALIGGNCLVDSPQWLRAMVRHTTRGREMVIGWAYTTVPQDAREAVTAGRRMRSFSTVRTALQYLAWGAAGHPWRANAANMVFHRALFDGSNGFAATLNLERGDDDMWVKEVAEGDFTAVELSPESMVTVLEEDLRAAHRADKLRHEFTSRRPGRSARLTFALASWLWWIGLGCAVAACIIGWPSLWPLIAMALVGITLCVPLMVRWRRVSARLHCAPLFLTVPWFVTIHPLYSVTYKLRAAMHKRDNYTLRL